MALHTTSDLLRLLAADGAPFADVAAAVVARFGADAASRAWLARTLVTLLRVRAAGGWLACVVQWPAIACCAR